MSDSEAAAAATANADPTAEFKADLLRYLQGAREAVVWKLEGLSEYHVRRPLVTTGTNLLGLVKHLASVEAGYFGEVFGRPFPDEPFPWFADDAEPNADLYAPAEQSRAEILDLYRRVWVHSDATIAALPLDTVGHVRWWRPGHRDVTLHRVLVHMTTETHRHAGHADIVRELVDGSAGLSAGNDNLWVPGDSSWGAYRAKLEDIAEGFREGAR